MQTVRRILVDELDWEWEEVGPEARLVEDMAADRYDVLELAVALEMECDIEVPDEESRGWTTVQSVVDYVAGQLEVAA